MSARLAPLRSSASSAPSSSRSVITAFHRATTIANCMPSAERSPSTATGLPFTGSVHAQKAERESRLRLHCKDARLPMGFGDRRQTQRRLQCPRYEATPLPPGARHPAPSLRRTHPRSLETPRHEFEIAEAEPETTRHGWSLHSTRVPLRIPAPKRSSPAGHRPRRSRPGAERKSL